VKPRPEHSSERGQSGQASVELVAILPALIVCVVVVAHVVPAGWALWSAANAARAGARAEHVGGDAERTARRALPSDLAERAKARAEGETKVRVRYPGLLAGVEPEPVGAASRLDPAGD
jgi:hypothetical protein